MTPQATLSTMSRTEPAATRRPVGRLMGMTQSAFDPASRVRFVQFIPLFEDAGWDVLHRPNKPDRQWRSRLPTRLARGMHYRSGRGVMKVRRLADIAASRGVDVVFVNRDLAGGRHFHERLLLRSNARVIFDFDDAIFSGSQRAEQRVRWMCEHAAWVTPGNAYLADWARRYNDHVTVIPTVVDTDRYESRQWSAADASRPVRIGWTGSDASIAHTLFPYLETIARAQREFDFEFVIVTNTQPSISTPGFRWTFHPWRAEEEGALGRLFDVCIMPLADNEFQRGKCGLKLLQGMAAGLPTIASPVGVNSEIVQPGKTGFLAQTPDEWHEALGTVARSPEILPALGANGRDRCVREYSLQRWFPEMLSLVERVAAMPRHRGT